MFGAWVRRNGGAIAILFSLCGVVLLGLNELPRYGSETLDPESATGSVEVAPEQRPVDFRAYGYESEDAMLADVRKRLNVPPDYSLSVYEHDVDGEPMIAVAVAIPESD